MRHFSRCFVGATWSVLLRYLAELNVPHETKLLDMRRGEHKQPAFLAINPFGKVSWQWLWLPGRTSRTQ